VKAVLLTGPGTFEVTTLADPAPTENDVVVEVAASGICGTDLHIMSGELGHVFPFVPGHEFSGHVTDVGRAVTSLKLGDRVAVDPGLPCHTCRACRTGIENHCSRRDGIGETLNGGAAELVRVPEHNAIRLPEALSTTDASLVEPLACALHGADSLGGVVGHHVLIYGAGTMGLVLTQLLNRSGAASVSVVDLRQERAEVALRFGAAAAATRIADLDRPQGWDVVIEASGSAGAIADALTSVARRGRLLQFGMASPHAQVTYNPYDVFDREIQIVGSKSYLHTFERAIDLLAAGILSADMLVTHRLPLADYGEAITLLRNGEGRKIQVAP
jgi:2-desacetyl-2-hydroxyethyl bacteriochlorophyllide A dehydrogenase